MKSVAYLIHLPFVILGAVWATIVVGFMAGYRATEEWWLNTKLED